jgi:hypothetical protein
MRPRIQLARKLDLRLPYFSTPVRKGPMWCDWVVSSSRLDHIHRPEKSEAKTGNDRSPMLPVLQSIIDGSPTGNLT